MGSRYVAVTIHTDFSQTECSQRRGGPRGVGLGPSFVFDLATAVGHYLPVDQDDQKLSIGSNVLEIIVRRPKLKAQLVSARCMHLPDGVMITSLIVSESR